MGCTSHLPSLPTEAIQTHTPAISRTFEFLDADFGEDDYHHFLFIIDQLIGWSQVTMFQNQNTTARRLIEAFRTFFVTTGGAPVKIWKDDVPF